ncbi:ATP synthase F1 subunit gamma [Candidatus Uhrbacteria bacterium]|nr:ATP synthase F1 subunit gamma [Candidatus Uhrbacteria bacterium]
MPSTLAIRRQIRSVRNTKKITKAMELVSGAKMRKAVASALATRSYAHCAWDLLQHLATRVDRALHPLLAVRPVRRSAVIIISSNRGLCGSFNAQLAMKGIGAIRRAQEAGAQQVDIITFGRRARDTVARHGYTIHADFPKADITTSIMDIAGIIHVITQGFSDGSLDRVDIVSSSFVSSIKQNIEAWQLLPLVTEGFVRTGITESATKETAKKDSDFSQFVFEPSEQQVLGHIIPRLLETQIFQAVLETEASEHSARMMAMHNATEAASEMVGDLELTYNRVRQSAITQEIAELSAGRAALE